MRRVFLTIASTLLTWWAASQYFFVAFGLKTAHSAIFGGILAAGFILGLIMFLMRSSHPLAQRTKLLLGEYANEIGVGVVLGGILAILPWFLAVF